MQKINKFLIQILAAIMSVSLSCSMVFAADSQGINNAALQEQETAKSSDSLSSRGGELPLPDENGMITVFPSDTSKAARKAETGTGHFEELQKPAKHPELHKEDLENALSIGSKARAASDVASIENVIDEANGMALYYPLDLEPGLIMRFIMECPEDPSLDYDLNLYQYDEATGDLTWVDASTYETHFYTDSHGKYKTLEESVSRANRSSSTETYALTINAVTGYSATKPYKLHLQIATVTDDVTEPNDSAFSATPSDLAPGSGSEQQVIEASMDQDWYWMGITDITNKDYDYVNVFAANASSGGNFDVEIYQANGRKMELVSPMESTDAYDKYELGIGYYYVRVFNYQFTTSDAVGAYDLQMDKKGYVARFAISYLVDIDPPIQTGYPQGRNYWFEHEFTAVVNVYDKWDNPIANEPVDVTWMSRMWPDNPERVVTKHGRTDSSGICKLKFQPLTEPGNFEHTITNGYISFSHSYAIDDILVACGGDSFTTWIYHFFLSTPHM